MAAWGTYRPREAAALCVGAMRYVARGKLRRPLRACLRRLAPICDIEAAGLRFRCNTNDNHAELRIVERGGGDNLRLFRRLAPYLRPGATFVDVGANCGFFTLMAARAVGPAGRVIAIEPADEMHRRLTFNIAANGFSNVRALAVAAGPSVGHAVLHVTPRQRGQSSLAPVAGSIAVTVPMLPLTEIAARANLARVDALKIDIEGYEDEALLPYIASAPRRMWPRAILMETRHAERWRRDCLAALAGSGYRIAWRGRSDVLMAL
ncbi:MAG TPA: FkbM family methyltransferase [Hyphomicrobiaceae bacterium]|nr:FkbM family methyltransferase [Hyphomicrobiaceae bacterium]